MSIAGAVDAHTHVHTHARTQYGINIVFESNSVVAKVVAVQAVLRNC
jgi:hypothetical protein